VTVETRGVFGEAAFLVIEERVEGMDRETARHEMLSTPTPSLYHIRKKWESQHALALAEWDVLMHYVQIGAEEEYRSRHCFGLRFLQENLTSLCWMPSKRFM